MKARTTQLPPDPVHETVKHLSNEFDKHTDNENPQGILDTIKEAEKLLDCNAINDISRASLYYSLATAYSDLEYLSKSHANEKNREHQIYLYRKSIDLLDGLERSDGLKPYILGLQQNVLTNYSNALSRNGRIIEAIVNYKRVLDYSPNYAMTLGNIGIVYMSYSMLMYDNSHRDTINYFGYQYLKKALSLKNQVHSQALEWFEKHFTMFDHEYIKHVLEPDLKFKETSFDSDAEADYRNWVLSNHIFINPLSDLPIVEDFIASDIMQLPNMVMSVKEGLNYKYHGMFNNLKQEYISARFLIYETTQLIDTPHYADKETNLVDTADYPSYSIRIEKLKLAFRSLYSIFDKAAFFINKYYDLGIQERDISFRSIWQSEKKGKNRYKYKNTLTTNKNRALNGIYWVFKDLFVKLYDSPSPHAKELNTLRNGLEHKYVKVYNSLFPARIDGTIDNCAVYISEFELEDHTMKLLHLARELLIYLSLSVHINEMQKKGTYTEKAIPSITLYGYEDDWKY